MTLYLSCPRVTFLGPDPTRRNVIDPTRPESTRPDPAGPSDPWTTVRYIRPDDNGCASQRHRW